MRVALYRIINREAVFQHWVDVPDATTFFDGWLHDNGYDKSYTIRRGLIDNTPYRGELGKPSAPLPSAAGRILGKLTKGK